MTELPAYTRSLRQTAIYWPPAAPDGLGGQTYGTAIEIRCRWQDVAVLFRNDQGEEETSDAVVYVDRVLQRKGYLALVSFVEDSSYATPHDVVGSKEIRQVNVSPSLRNQFQVNKVYL